MKSEYGVETTLEPLPYSLARWALGGWEGVDAAGRLFNALATKDQWGRPVRPALRTAKHGPLLTQ